MSTPKNIKNTRKSVVPPAPEKRPFCKVCHDSGKPEDVFTNHWVKDKTGKVCCPTLLAQECRYCSHPGHTVSYCPVLAERKTVSSIKPVGNIAQKKELVKTTTPSSRTKNAFDCLSEDSDEEAEKEEEDEMDFEIKTPAGVFQEQEQDEFPALSTNVTLRSHQTAYSYAQALIAPMPKPEPIHIPTVTSFKMPARKWTSWADAESSDDEDEDA